MDSNTRLAVILVTTGLVVGAAIIKFKQWRADNLSDYIRQAAAEFNRKYHTQ